MPIFTYSTGLMSSICSSLGTETQVLHPPASASANVVEAAAHPRPNLEDPLVIAHLNPSRFCLNYPLWFKLTHISGVL